ncbi:DUF4097 family beta strand repeat-containing protein [Dokdonella fugitiva]|jgi:DUF4097 and DUF4098 domain-containing protein YvlB|uniref:DUF4097 and DUF4098 domain-containing protein YvlB n=1 Tax=Dokdonella fugitiva TaxID=328517 RepID=A0A4R2HYY5_9GAMM|nr:DUF4097 family beta strand repeat-containing protein [Dokdonella fugitiva]TCO36871.1 DUF4097 and DUF4098 domain-containing protein YvlB [Dokdonella fugitiva]
MKAAASTALALAIAFALGDARAGTPINEHRDVSPTAQIDVSNVKGSVTVSGWDKPEVSITGTLGDGAKKLSVEGSADHLRIKVEPPDRQGWFSWGADTRMSDSVLDVRVPKNAEMKIEVVSADVTLSGVAGRRLDVDGVSGKLRLESSAKEVEIDSVSGDIDITGNAERAHVETVSGNIRARGLGGQVKFDTVSGDVDAENAGYREITAGTVSGDVSLRGKPDAGARVEVETMSGDVHLFLPADLSARVNASSFSGRIRSDFGTVSEPEHGPGSSLEVTTGSGSGQVKLETFSGDIDIRKQ